MAHSFVVRTTDETDVEQIQKIVQFYEGGPVSVETFYDVQIHVAEYVTKEEIKETWKLRGCYAVEDLG